MICDCLELDCPECYPLPPADPNPMFRCRCVGWMTDDGWQNSYMQRCPTRPTQEDGLCDHCRQVDSCTDPLCPDQDGTKGWGCCRQSYATRALVDIATPCGAF